MATFTEDDRNRILKIREDVEKLVHRLSSRDRYTNLRLDEIEAAIKELQTERSKE